MAENRYTFGDNTRASARLRRLAEVYEPETRALLDRCPVHAPALAVDLGAGPGWSTRLVQSVLSPVRTVGLEASERYAEEARHNAPGAEFIVCDVTRSPLPVERPEVLFCRFLLTHLRDLHHVLGAWAAAAAPGARLLVHETERLEADHPTLRRYYELVGQLQRHYGQLLHVGESLGAAFNGTGWVIEERVHPLVEKPAVVMAELHLANLRTWRDDAFARAAFDAGELEHLDASLERIARGDEEAGIVRNTACQIQAKRA